MKTCPLYIQSAIPHMLSRRSYDQLMTYVACSGPDCAWWDGEDCAINPKPKVGIININEYLDPTPSFDLYKTQLIKNIEILLEEKTGWGRVDRALTHCQIFLLKKKLYDLIETTGLER